MEKETKLIDEISRLESNIAEHHIENLNSKQRELDELRKEKLKGAFIRSRAKWVEEGKNHQTIFVT